MSGARIAAIIVKELRQVSRDPATLGMLLVLPLFLLLMFGYAISLDVKHIPLAVLDRDQTRDEPDVHPVLPAFRVLRPQRRHRQRDRRSTRCWTRAGALVALVVPRGFGEDAAAGQPGRGAGHRRRIEREHGGNGNRLRAGGGGRLLPARLRALAQARRIDRD